VRDEARPLTRRHPGDGAPDDVAARENTLPATQSGFTEGKVLEVGVVDAGGDAPCHPFVALARQEISAVGLVVLEDVDAARAGGGAEAHQHARDARLPVRPLEKGFAGEHRRLEDRFTAVHHEPRALGDDETLLSDLAAGLERGAGFSMVLLGNQGVAIRTAAGPFREWEAKCQSPQRCDHYTGRDGVRQRR